MAPRDLNSVEARKGDVRYEKIERNLAIGIGLQSELCIGLGVDGIAVG